MNKNKFFSRPQWLTDILADPFKKYLIIILALVGIVQYATIPSGEKIFTADAEGGKEVLFFFHPNCPHCAEQKEFNRYLASVYPRLSFQYYDVSTPGGARTFYKSTREKGINLEQIAVPVTIIGPYVIKGFNAPQTTGVTLEKAVQAYINDDAAIFDESDQEWMARESVDLPLFGKLRLADFSLLSLAIILGLVDGFNPCAMWVLVYLISIIVSLNDRRKIWIIVGSFVFASGVLYFLFMTAWLNIFLYMGYLRLLTTLIGLFALGSGILSIREYVITKGAITCKVGDAEQKQKTRGRIAEIVSAPISVATIFAIILLAFTINSIEFACSAALPAIYTHTLSLRQLTLWSYYGYILVYVFFFMLDDLIIFSLAALALDTAYGNRYAKYCKLIGGVVLVVLGGLMTFKPDLLQ